MALKLFILVCWYFIQRFHNTNILKININLHENIEIGEVLRSQFDFYISCKQFNINIESKTKQILVHVWYFASMIWSMANFPELFVQRMSFYLIFCKNVEYVSKTPIPKHISITNHKIRFPQRSETRFILFDQSHLRHLIQTACKFYTQTQFIRKPKQNISIEFNQLHSIWRFKVYVRLEFSRSMCASSGINSSNNQ